MVRVAAVLLLLQWVRGTGRGMLCDTDVGPLALISIVFFAVAPLLAAITSTFVPGARLISSFR